MINSIKLAFKAFYRRVLFALSANNNFLFIAFYKYLYKPSKGSLSHFLDIYSRQNKPLFIVQIGANDGISHDPVHKYIKRDNCEGVLLEPQKDVFDRFLTHLYHKNKGIRLVNAALGYADGVSTLYKISFSNARWATGLATFNRSVLEKAFHSGHVAKQAQKENIKVPASINEGIAEEKIEVISSKTLIQRYGIKKIDLLQVDTEGFDFEIIKMFDMNIIKPRAIIYENSHLPDALKEECRQYLINNGYAVKNYGGNTLAVLQPYDEIYAGFLK